MWTKNNMPDQSGKTVLITGANTGIGYQTALAFYEKGANVILACRSLGNAKAAIEKIKLLGGTGTLEPGWLNLSSLEDIKQFSKSFLQKNTALDVLVNNAGVMIPPASKTEDGYELQFGVNFLGHYALTGYLYPLLKATPGARVVTVSSMAYLHGAIDFDNLRSEKSYDPTREYSQSKLANILFALELQRKIEAAADGIVSLAAQPGANKTELARHMSEEAYSTAVERVGELMEPWQGALPTLYAATEATVAGGDFYSPDKDGGYRGYPAKFALAPNGLDEAAAQKLWAYAERETGVKYGFGS